mgnify:CR=1 FL=1
MKQLKPSKRKPGMMIPITKFLIMLLRRKMSKCPELENGSDAYFEAVSEKTRTANFIHPILLPERLNTKLKTSISTCEV